MWGSREQLLKPGCGQELPAAREVEVEVRDRDSARSRLALLLLAVTLSCCALWMLWNPLCAFSFRQKPNVVIVIDEEPRLVMPLKCSLLPPEFRFDCFPSTSVNQSSCEERGCCWSPPSADFTLESEPLDQPLGQPFCFYPAGYESYALVNVSRSERIVTAYYTMTRKSGYPKDIRLIRMDVVSDSNNILGIKIVDATQDRFEVPFLSTNIVDDIELSMDELEYKVRISARIFGFQVLRSSGEIIFDALSVGGFVYSDQLLQLSALLPSHLVFGLGEHRSPFLKSTGWTQFTMWNFDQPPGPYSTNMYGSHPFYMAMEEDAKSHGVFLRNSNAMEILLQPTPGITFRTIGGILDFVFMLGPTPAQVAKQYASVVGLPFLPPFWSLGYHQCRYGYGSLNRTRKVLERTMAAGIPIDTQWNDLDYMHDRNDFTVDQTAFAGLGDFVNELHSNGMHYVVIVDPGVSGSEPPGSYPPYDRGLEMDVFIKNASGNVFIGKVWNPNSTVWPDFTHPNATPYWTGLIEDFYKQVAIDGAWIDMNEPSNFESGQKDVGCVSSSPLDSPPYVPRFVTGNALHFRTVCPSARHAAGAHYDVHNLYALSEAIVTNEALRAVRSKRPFVISRASFAGLGHYAGHWTGDIHADWDSMKQSVTDIQTLNMLGIPMVGADICGFTGNTTVKLCNRWVQLGAFYPFSRNHNDLDATDQDPVSMGPQVTASAKKAIETRYTLLPYLYNLFVVAHLRGETVARPVLFEFPDDKNTYFIGDRQFMWGPALMIVPVLDESIDDYVECYLPGGVWYNLYDHRNISTSAEGSFVRLAAPVDTIPLLARGGHVMVMKPVANTTTQSRRLPFELHVYLDLDGRSVGELFWDDGDGLDTYERGLYAHVLFACEDGVLKSYVDKNGFTSEEMRLGLVRVMGVTATPSAVLVNGAQIEYTYDEQKQMLVVDSLNLDLRVQLFLTFN